MPFNINPFEVRDFTGGLTDHQNTNVPNVYLKMDNLLFDANGEILTRYGSIVYNTARLPSGNQRVSKIVNYNDDTALIILSGTRAFYDNAGAWTEILSPAAGVALPNSTVNSNFMVAEWKRHLFITNDTQIQPIKIIKDDTQGWLSITAGLPKMAATPNYVGATALASAITLANAIRTAILAHFADGTLQHKVVDTVSAALVAAVATNLPTLLTLTTSLTQGYLNHFNDYQTANIYHIAETNNIWTSVGDQILASTLAPTTLETCVALLNDLKTKYNQHWGKVDIHQGNSPANNVTSAFLYGVTSGPFVDLNRQTFYDLATSLQHSLTQHFLDDSTLGGQTTNAHKAPDSNNFNDLNSFPHATDPESLAFLVEGLWSDYYNHETDAAQVTPTFHPHTEISSHQLSIFSPPSWQLYSGYTDEFSGLEAGNWTKLVTRLTELNSKVLSHINEAGLAGTTAHIAGSVYYKIAGTGPNGALQYISKYALNGTCPQLGSYNYAVTYSYTYTLNGFEFLEESEPFFFAAENVIKPEFEGLLVQGIVPLVNTAATNYDVANIKVNIYRTTNNGTTYFLSGSVANGATTYIDYVVDNDLINRQRLYTNGGVNPNSLPPQAKFVIVTNDIGYYGNFAGNSNRIVQSQPGTPDGVWGGNFVDLPFDVQGLAAFRGIPITWTANQIYRLEGQFDDLGNGQLVAVPIATNIGLSASFSPVAYDAGVVFAGQDGFYLTDGYRVQKINTYWRDTYLNLIRSSSTANHIHGVYEKNKRRMWWVTNTNSADNDSCYVLDANFPLTNNSVFSSASGGTNFSPTSIGYFKGQIIRGDSRGYVFKHDPAYLNDPKVNTGAAPSTWTTAWVTYTYQSPYYDFGTLLMRKWNPRVNVKCRNNGNLSLQVNLFTDNNTAELSALSPLYYRGGSDIIEQRGHTPAGFLRCRNRSVQFTNAFVVIQNSDTKGTATLDRVAKTLTLGGAWTGDQVDQIVTFPGDSYTQQFTVTAQAGTVLTLSDPGNLLPGSGVTKWEIKGYPKDELFQLVSYALHVANIGKNQPVIGLSNGANA